VNPHHLFLGDAKDNSMDMMRKGRDKHGVFPGESNPRAIVKETDVFLMREMYLNGTTIAEIMKKYPQLERSAVSSIITGRNWTYLKLTNISRDRKKTDE
jgi:hypothetical protein